MAGKAFGWFSLLAVFFLVFSSGNTQRQIKNKELQRILGSNKISEVLQEIFRSSINTSNVLKTGGNVSKSCNESLYDIMSHEDITIQYLDAAGKPPSAIFLGNVLWLGSFDSCQDLSDSHYCLLSFNANLTIEGKKNETDLFHFRLGTCVPNTCGTDDIQYFLMKLYNVEEMLLKVLKPFIPKSAKNIALDITYDKKSISCPKKPQYTSDVIATLVFCGFLLLLCLLGTIVDMITGVSNNPTGGNHVQDKSNTTSRLSSESVESQLINNEYQSTSASTYLVFETRASKPWCVKEGALVDFFLCFSLIGNTKKIFATKVTSVSITSINGVRVISMFWVILGHTFLFLFTSSIAENIGDFVKDIPKLSVMVILNAYFSVDSFFFLSGLLVAYTCLRKMEKSNGRFNWVFFYVHRYLRLTPTLMFVILFYVKLKPLLIYSPLWNTEDKLDPCNKYWWTNLIYINNFYPTEFIGQCVSWSWYLANDMQFFVITPVFLILASRFGWRGLFASAGSLILVSSIIIASLIGYYNLDPMVLGKFNIAHPLGGTDTKDFANMVYGKPYTRIQPYLVGFFLGYFIHKSYSGTRRPGWLLALLGWVIAATVGMTLLYAPHKDVVPGGRTWSKAENVIYGTLERLLWGLAVAWVTYACHFGYGGLVQQFLSARFWIPLSRLTYSTYLVHPIVIMFMYSGAKSTIFYSFTTIAYYFIDAVVLSYGAAFILAVTIEFPCDNLGKLAMRPFQNRP